MEKLVVLRLCLRRNLATSSNIFLSILVAVHLNICMPFLASSQSVLHLLLVSKIQVNVVHQDYSLVTSCYIELTGFSGFETNQ